MKNKWDGGLKPYIKNKSYIPHNELEKERRILQIEKKQGERSSSYEDGVEPIPENIEVIIQDAIKYINIFLNKLRFLGVDIEDAKREDFNIFKVVDDVSKYQIVSNRILISEDKLKEDYNYILRTMIHEMYHNMSHNDAKIIMDNTDGDFRQVKKSGLSSTYWKYNDGEDIFEAEELFEAVNEGMTDSLTFLTLEGVLDVAGYYEEIDLIFEIIKTIYPDKKESLKVIEYYFNGNTFSFLRDIERYYGIEALRLLSKLKIDIDLTEEEKKERQKIITFFMNFKKNN